MKMMCPQCGVKGSIDDALFLKKVKCPKCLSIFQVTAELIEAIPVIEEELEPVEDVLESGDELSSEEEVDDVLSALLSGEDDSFEDEPIVPATLLDTEEESAEDVALEDDFFGDDDEDDDTLVIIEDIPSGSRKEEAGEALFDDDEADIGDLETAIAEEAESREPAAEEEAALSWDDDIFADETEEAESREPAAEEETALSWDDDIFVDEAEEKREEEKEEESDILAFDDDLFDDDDEQDKEISPAPEDMEESVLDASFLEDPLDEGGEEDDDEEDDDEEDDDEDEGLLAVQKCAACDEYVDPDNKHELGGNLYCAKCVPTEGEGAETSNVTSDATAEGADYPEDDSAAADAAASHLAAVAPGRFTMATLLKDAWHYSKGVKGSIWGGTIVMDIILFGCAYALLLLGRQLTVQEDPITALAIGGGLQMLLGFLSFLFSAGLLMIAVNKIGQKYFSWKMVFMGLKRFGSLLLLFVLQSIMLTVGFILFIIPGIYLAVGYVLAIPLVLSRGLSPWQALEASRQAVHKRWWTIFFSLIAMSLVMSVSAIPLGLGLIWTVPMFFVLIGVMYYHFFGMEEE